ncbi:MAG: hypothetical protein A3J83_04800 [Elusimicrobia bacterium RIFOXYA2_FULL_40_6]|nr:MAG: hypothetical protein A3J83_04800 [Elusimicrobia bacterium RIFOXYA2_FULL_40_6]
MTRRERVLMSLQHKQPDRIPIDLGAMDSTGITGIAYNRLKKYLGINGGKTQVFDPYQQVVKIEKEVLEIIGADVMSLPLEPRKWKASTLPDGSSCEIPENWNQEKTADGSLVVKGADGNIVARMPEGGLYFEPVNPPLASAETVKDIESKIQYIENFDWPSFCDESFDDLGKKAKNLYETTDYAIMGNFAVHILAAGQLLRGFEQFMVDLMINPEIAECIMDNLVNSFTKRFDKYNAAVGKYVQIVNVNDDLGTEAAPMLSKDLYQRTVGKYHKKLYRHIKKDSNLYLFLHTDGSVYDLIPDLIEAGVDILNPVQFSCKDMQLERLKKEFGSKLTFWGGGCDTQKVLPFKNAKEVKENVKQCISVLAPGGGFVFNQVHNIQPDVSPENIMAMYEAVKEFKY